MDWFDQLEDMNRPKVDKRDWMDEKTMVLVTEESLDRVVEECIAAGLFAWDIETTGLDNRVFFGADGSPYTTDRIVGHCLSADGKTGYYVPVRHINEQGDSHKANISAAKVNRALKRLADSEAVAIFHHGKFDQEFLQFSESETLGEWEDPEKWEDTNILAYVRNTRERNKGLKFLSMQELGMDMIELHELFTDEQRKSGKLDFSLLDPTWDPCLWYACSDAICTRLLYDVLHPVVHDPEPTGRSQATVYRLEKMCVPSTRWMERCRIYIDREKVEELIRLGQEEWFESLEEVYSEATKILGRDIRPGWYRLMRGIVDIPSADQYVFDPQQVFPDHMAVREEAKKRADQANLDPQEVGPNGKNQVQTITKEVPSLVTPSKKERVAFPVVYDVTIAAHLGALLRELGVKGLKATEKSGQVATGKDVLDRVIDAAGDQFPFMKKVKRFRETKTALGNNLIPLWHDTSSEHSPDGTVRVGFNAHKIDTGRFCTPKPADKKVFHGQVRWNIHSIPATYDKNKPACMLRIRECVRARPGHILFAIDYAGVELRIVTNLSREPKWLDEFFRCNGCGMTFDRGVPGTTPEAPPSFCPRCGSDKIGDLHSLTALGVYGEGIKADPKVFKSKRQKAKGLNFAMCYGGGGLAAQRSVGVDKDEGWRIKRQFDATYQGLQAWWGTQHRFAKRYKFVETAFGRRYPLPDIDHEMGGFRAKAERNAVNGPVQGTSADIIKLAMALLYKAFKKRGWLGRVKMTITIHDELVFEIPDDIAEEVIDVIVPIMTRCKPILRLNWPIPLKVDIEAGDDWTVPHNMTELEYNKANNWTPRLARAFPKRYAKYLSLGGAPLDGVEAPDVEVAQVSPDNGKATVEMSVPLREQFEPPDTGKGKVCTHVVHSSRLTYGLMGRLAHVIHQAEGHGLETLRVVTEDGVVLWDDPNVMISATKFKVLADEYQV